MISLRCPICGRTMQASGTAEWPHFPFCSDRCRLIDLGRWLGERYRLPTPAEGEPPEADSSESELP